MSSRTPTTDRKPAMLIQLLYRSDSVAGVSSALEMSDILAQARPANARDKITGVLTSCDGIFVQIVEGPEAAIDGLMHRLARDPRHRAVEVLERRATRERAFGDWDMVSPRLAGMEISLISTLLSAEDAAIDAYITVLSRAISRQDAVLEGRETPAPVAARPPSHAVSTPPIRSLRDV